MKIGSELLYHIPNLPKDYRNVLTLYYLDKKSQKEISLEKRISLYQFKGYLSKGLFLLRKLAEEPELKEAERILNEMKIN